MKSLFRPELRRQPDRITRDHPPRGQSATGFPAKFSRSKKIRETAMEMKRTKFTTRACVVLSCVAMAYPAWAADRPINKLGISAPVAKASLRRATIGKTKHLTALRAGQLGRLNNRGTTHRPTLIQQALAITSTARSGEAETLLDQHTSFRSRFTSASMKDAIGKLREAAGFR
jgi:hypothetical protein